MRALSELVADLSLGYEFSVLDVGMGAGDFPRAITGWARRQGLHPRVIATDIDPIILQIPTDKEIDSVEYRQADGRSLPFADQSFNVATCSLLLHHLEPPDAVRVVSELQRVSRLGFVVNDLVRSWVGLLGAYLVTRAISRNTLTRHDGPLSVRRAYTRQELQELIVEAGVSVVRVRGIPGYRVTITNVKAGGERGPVR